MGKKREKYAAMACTRCRSKKLRCVYHSSDGVAKPQPCDRCVRAGVECVYAGRTPSKKRKLEQSDEESSIEEGMKSQFHKSRSPPGHPQKKRIKLSVQTSPSSGQRQPSSRSYAGASLQDTQLVGPDHSNVLEHTISPAPRSYRKETDVLSSHALLSSTIVGCSHQVVSAQQQQSAPLLNVAGFASHPSSQRVLQADNGANADGTFLSSPSQGSHFAMPPPVVAQQQAMLQNGTFSPHPFFAASNAERDSQGSSGKRRTSSNSKLHQHSPAQLQSFQGHSTRHGKSNDFSTANILTQHTSVESNMIPRNPYSLTLEKMNSSNSLTTMSSSITPQQSPLQLFDLHEPHSATDGSDSGTDANGGMLLSPTILSPIQLGENLWSDVFGANAGNGFDSSMSEGQENVGLQTSAQCESPVGGLFGEMHPLSQRFCANLNSILQQLDGRERERVTKDLIHILSVHGDPL